jgi:DNA-binding CsgD family transcriptional regulator
MKPLAEVIEVIDDLPLHGGHWHDAMGLLHERFDTNMEALYFLDLAERRTRVVELQGVTPAWLAQFSPLYFLPDNPCVRYSARMHRPGVVRTAGRLAAFIGEPDVLERSTYYNEWMRPQHFAHTMGVTPYVEDGVVANISLFRPADMPAFGATEIADMQRLAPHVQRALQFCLRLERAAQSESMSLGALDGLEDGAAVVDERGVLRHANKVVDDWLRGGTRLGLDHGRLQARTEAADQALAQLIADTAAGLVPHADVIDLADENGRTLNVKAMRVRGATVRYLPPRTFVLLLFSEPRTGLASAMQQAGERYRLTRAELRLATHLAAGTGLRDAATRCSITYGTARTYLKLLFHKTGTHRQSELVARLLGRNDA